MLNNVEWGEFKLGDLFDIHSSAQRFDANKVALLPEGRYPYVVRQAGNNGQRGYLEEAREFLNPGNTLAFGQDTATVTYQPVPYFTGDKVKIFEPLFGGLNRRVAQFFVAAISRSFSTYGWGTKSYSVPALRNETVHLPITLNEQPDYRLMERLVAELEARRVAELEARRVAELEAYLKATGLSNTTLTADEQQALHNLENGGE